MCTVVEMEPNFPLQRMEKAHPPCDKQKGGSNKCLRHVFNAGYPTWATRIKMDFSFRTPLVPFVQLHYDKRRFLSSNLTTVGFGIYAKK